VFRLEQIAKWHGPFGLAEDVLDRVLLWVSLHAELKYMMIGLFSASLIRLKY
jgi:hypothetical protein